MSEFKFGCPECGQKISCDASDSGAQITCPACQKLLTVPAAVPAASLVFVPLGQTSATAPGAAPLPAPKPSLWELATAAPGKEAGGVGTAAPAAGYSILAMVSLFYSVWVPLGFIPGIICGHLARVKMRGNPQLKGQEMATAGLAISYTGLGLVLAVMGPILLMHQRYQPIVVERATMAELTALKPRIVDEVKIGPAGEGGNEAEHKLLIRGFSRSDSFARHNWREATSGGAFSYEMKVLPGAAMSVNCRYYGTETTLRLFDIIVEDQIVGTQELKMNNPGHYFDVEYKIPRGVTKGKSQVRVELMAHGGMTAGRLFGIETLKH